MTEQEPPAQAGEPISLADHKLRISHAASLPDPSVRDASLISALRGVSAELEAAEEDHIRATGRLETARELFDWATGALSGYSKTAKDYKAVADQPRRGRKRKGGENYVDDEEADRVRFTNPNEGHVEFVSEGWRGGLCLCH